MPIVPKHRNIEKKQRKAIIKISKSEHVRPYKSRKQPRVVQVQDGLVQPRRKRFRCSTTNGQDKATKSVKSAIKRLAAQKTSSRMFKPRENEHVFPRKLTLLNHLFEGTSPPDKWLELSFHYWNLPLRGSVVVWLSIRWVGSIGTTYDLINYSYLTPSLYHFS